MKVIRNIFKLKKWEESKNDINKNIRNVINIDNIHNIQFENNGDRDKSLLTEKYFDKIKTYLEDFIFYLQNPYTWKIQLTITINFLSSEDTIKEWTIH